MKGLLITLGVVVLLGLMVAFWAVGLSNSEIKLRNTGEAQETSNSAYFDKMWKIISQDNQAAEKYKNAFKDIYVAVIEGRYSQKDADGNFIKNDGSLMKLIVESNPNFTPDLYNKLMTQIEAQREGFFTEQQKLIDIDRQHKNMRMTFPNTLILAKRHNIGYQVDENGKVIKEGITIITSSKTDEVLGSGKENDVTL